MSNSNFLDSEWGVWTVLFGLSFTIAPDLGPFVLLALIIRGAIPIVRAIWHFVDRTGSGAMNALRRMVERSRTSNLPYLGPSEQELKDAEEREQLRVQNQQRREDTRAACEVLFHLHAHALAERFPKSVFDDFVNRYMGDGQTPEYVEQRGRQLTELILQHARKVSSVTEDLSLTAALGQYQEHINQIQNSNLDEEWKASLISTLQEKFYEQLHFSLENKP